MGRLLVGSWLEKTNFPTGPLLYLKTFTWCDLTSSELK